MKNKIVNDEKISVFGKISRKIKDFFYDLSVKRASKKPVKPVSIKSNNFNRKVFYYSMVAIPFLHYLIFYIGVNFNSILLAFKEMKLVNDIVVTDWGGFINFTTFFNNFIFGTELKNMLVNSLIYYFVGLIVGVPCALIFSYYIYKKYFFSEFFRVILFFPSMISSVVTVFMYKYLIDYGVVEFVGLFNVEIMPPTGEPIYMRSIVIFFNIMMGFGVNILMYSSAMTRIPISVVEYAALDGVRPFREFLTITIPLIFDTISTFLIVGVSGIFINQVNLYAMYDRFAGSNISTLGYHLYVLTVHDTDGVNYPYAAAMGLIFTVIAVPITFGARWFFGEINPDVQY